MNKKLLMTPLAIIMTLISSAVIADSDKLSKVSETLTQAKSINDESLRQTINDVESIVTSYSSSTNQLKEIEREKESLESELDQLQQTLEEKEQLKKEKTSEVDSMSAKVSELRTKVELKKAEADKKINEEKKQAEQQSAVTASSQATQQPTQQQAQTHANSTHEYTLEQFMFTGRVYWGGYQYTYYSQSVKCA